MVVVLADEKFPLGGVIASECNVTKVSLQTGQFADTEWHVQLDDVAQLKSAHVLLVGQFEPFSRLSINDQLTQLLFLAHQAKLHGAHSITALIPYLPYARQCKDVKSEHTGPFEAIGKFCACVGMDEIISCEVHELACQNVLSLPLHEIQYDTIWYDLLRNVLDTSDLCFLSPDHGGVTRVGRVAKHFNAPTAFVTKRRVAPDQSVAMDLEGDVKDKTVILIDDIIDTGITATQAAEKALENGAKCVHACFVHPVLSAGSIDRLQKSSIEKIWVCDTIMLDGIDLGSKITIVPTAHAICAYVCERLQHDL